MAKAIAYGIGEHGFGNSIWSVIDQAWLVDVRYSLDTFDSRDTATFKVFPSDVVAQNPLALLPRVKEAIIQRAIVRFGVTLGSSDILYIP